MAITQERLEHDLQMSSQAIKGINHKLAETRQSIYLALEEVDFVWDSRLVAMFDLWWRNGLSIEDMARALKRDIDEVVLLAFDRAMKGHIKPRMGGVFGKGMGM